ncbi:hypothetical protein HBI56_096310 [Parastagonospora nodorum]|uniref:Uncharacterized protein n=1 Tax=Phaeosphaeria nodorum (strain SN15 / ATCC MYA-4574 / FGSC 10173) TaxID=321614 RepID=A0A7U2F431_PHANO|nr:hypothetical protein HBH56_091700 [Parastagonospora nodorum]QRC98319.1 hypothetical protein JI435_043940 [Parastagonospora nodorum SN15]KAH3936126.1 hypothetical protein HBH54_026340 [Parastagonospora nodorum]KAH3957723.1 hypothetical protein HBH51_221210 [Parastagonospora nodorum]KAH3989544.1 hypothetical protein HBH52_016980 [Parastagonospora nodorum]
MFFQKGLLASALALCAISAPLPECDEPRSSTLSVAQQLKAPTPPPPGTLTAEKLIQIAPATASCSGGDFAAECADATRATAAINKAFSTYKITEKGEKAALVAYMLFESGNFKYNRNHFPAPGRPGQGTRMMAMPPFISKYATAVAGATAVGAAEAQGPDAVLSLVNDDDEKSFGSAPWFLTATCSPEVRAGLVAETTEGWHNFLTECVGTTAAPERDAPWIAAKQVING